jgi:hypothetical protein
MEDHLEKIMRFHSAVRHSTAEIRKRGCTEAPVKKEPEGHSTQDKLQHNQKNML